MQTVLIITDFTPASRHALDYACLLLRDKPMALELLHIFPIPVTYTADAIALTAVQPAIERAEDLLDGELAYVRATYPSAQIKGRVITGSFLETLRSEAAFVRPMFLVLGTAGFTDLYLGDDDPLNALKRIQVPVLFIPQGAALRPVRHITYACNYAYAGSRIPAQAIARWVRFMEAKLRIVHTGPDPQGMDAQQQAGAAWLRAHFAALAPEYTWVEDSDVLHGLTGFISTHEVDCVLVVPRRYGIWQNLFRNSRTKALARLNKVPVIAFHELDV